MDHSKESGNAEEKDYPTKDEDQMHSSTFKSDKQQPIQHKGDTHDWRYTRSDTFTGFRT